MPETNGKKAKPRFSFNSAETKQQTYQTVMNLLTTRTEMMRKFLEGGPGGHDIDKECGYPSSFTAAEYRRLFEREGIASRVVRFVPQECWKTVPAVYETEESTETEFEKQWKLLLQNQPIWNVLERADIQSGIGRFGLILFGIDDKRKLSEPVEGFNEKTGEVAPGNRERKLLFLRVYGEDKIQLTNTDLETDETSPRYGMPRTYSIAMGNVDDVSSVKKVHWTRVLHIADDRMDSEIFGTPRMSDVLNRIIDIRKVLGGCAEMFWKGGFPGMAFELSPGVEAMDAASIRGEVEKYYQGLQRYVAFAGLSAKSLAVNIADPQPHLKSLLEAVAIAKGIPLRIFLGSERGELASSQDAKAWNERVAGRQENYINPFILRPFIQRLINYGVLPEPMELIIAWPDLNAPTDKEKAEVGEIRMRTLKEYVTGSVHSIAAPMEAMTIIAGFSEDESKSLIDSVGDLLDEEGRIVVEKESDDPENDDEEEPPNER